MCSSDLGYATVGFLIWQTTEYKWRYPASKGWATSTSTIFRINVR